MFSARSYIGSPDLPTIRRRLPRGAATYSPKTGNFLRVAAFCGLLALGLPGSSAAQAIGTMRVSARVLSATMAWSGLSEAGMAAQDVAWVPRGRPLVRRTELIQTRAEIHRSGDRRLVLVTIQYPHN